MGKRSVHSGSLLSSDSTINTWKPHRSRPRYRKLPSRRAVPTGLRAFYDAAGHPLSKKLVESWAFQPVLMLHRVSFVSDSRFTAKPMTEASRNPSTIISGDAVDSQKSGSWCSVM